MNVHENQERKDLQYEIKARKIILKKIANPLERLVLQAEKKLEARKARAAELTEYESVEEARDAYGWDIITEEEFYAICELFEKGESSILNERSADEYAAKMLGEYVGHINAEIRSFEFELLPDEEKERLRLQADKVAERLKKQR